MMLTDAQLRGKIKNYAKENNADARVLMRLYMMERFLKRVSISKYRDNFIIKGGVLVTSMLDVSLRSTMDIDTTIQDYDLSVESTKRMVDTICHVHDLDGITFKITNTTKIMDELEYPGIRFNLQACLGRMIIPIKIDISTGDVITPCAVEFKYQLMLEDRSISLMSYNVETLLAEKLQTILARGILNTRMRDFYDVYILLTSRKKEINKEIFKQAFLATCKSRQCENLITNLVKIYDNIKTNERLTLLWNSYQNKYPYAKNITFQDILQSVQTLIFWL